MLSNSVLPEAETAKFENVATAVYGAATTVTRYNTFGRSALLLIQSLRSMFLRRMEVPMRL